MEQAICENDNQGPCPLPGFPPSSNDGVDVGTKVYSQGRVMNSSGSTNAGAFGPLGAPGIGVQNSYASCMTHFGFHP